MISGRIDSIQVAQLPSDLFGRFTLGWSWGGEVGGGDEGGVENVV